MSEVVSTSLLASFRFRSFGSDRHRMMPSVRVWSGAVNMRCCPSYRPVRPGPEGPFDPLPLGPAPGMGPLAEGYGGQMRRILVAIDDSEASVRAADFVHRFFADMPVEILAVNVAEGNRAG